MKVYNAAIVRTMLYASETWCLNKEDLTKLEVFQMSCLRTILGVTLYDKWRNHKVLKTTDQTTISVHVKKNRLRWLGHVARRGEDSIPHLLWSSDPPKTWKCVRNAPKKTWWKEVQKDLEPLKSTYGSANWLRDTKSIVMDLASDRKQWQNICGMLGQAPAIK